MVDYGVQSRENPQQHWEKVINSVNTIYNSRLGWFTKKDPFHVMFYLQIVQEEEVLSKVHLPTWSIKSLIYHLHIYS